jgi:ATP-binding cassette subfamily B (MDR/TAP) protein 1
VTQYLVTLVASVGVAFYMAWDLTLVTLATFPIGAFALSFISSRMQSAIQSQTEELTTASKIATSAIAAIDTVKCFNGQEHELQKYTTTIKRAAMYYVKQARGNALQSGFVRILLLGMFVQGFWYGSYLVDNGRRTTGQIFTCFYSCLMATQTFEQVLPHVIVLEKGKAAGAAMRSLLNRIKSGVVVEKGGRGRTPEFCDGAIEVKNVGRDRAMDFSAANLVR